MTQDSDKPIYAAGQHIVGQDGTHGYVQTVTQLFGEVQYVLDHETILGQREVIGFHDPGAAPNFRQFP